MGGGEGLESVCIGIWVVVPLVGVEIAVHQVFGKLMAWYLLDLCELWVCWKKPDLALGVFLGLRLPPDDEAVGMVIGLALV